MSRRKYKDLPDNAIVGLKVETSSQSNIEDLALQLGEAMQNAINFRSDAKSFREHAVLEKQRIKELKKVLLSLEKRKENPPAKISRMDPLSTYSIQDIKSEIALANKRFKEFSTIASSSEAKAVSEDNKSIKLQHQITEMRSKLNKGTA